MLTTNDQSHVGPQPEERAQREMKNSMAKLRQRLEAMRPMNGMDTTSREGEIHSLVGGDITNLLLMELIEAERADPAPKQAVAKDAGG